MPDDRGDAVQVHPELNLSDQVTVFITTVGAPSYDACLDHLGQQDCQFATQIIDRVAPMNTAFQKMLDDCTTPYYVQLDEDMLLRPNAVRWLYKTMIEAEPNVAIVCAYLFDVHLERPIQGVKIFRHDIVRNYPFAAVESCELNHNERLELAGFKVRIFEPEEIAESDDGTLGLHGTHWTPETIYDRFSNLERKYRRFPEKLQWVAELPGPILQRFLEEGSEIDAFALLGVIAGRLASIDDAGTEKDYRTYKNLPGFRSAGEFVEDFAGDKSTSAR